MLLQGLKVAKLLNLGSLVREAKRPAMFVALLGKASTQVATVGYKVGRKAKPLFQRGSRLERQMPQNPGLNRTAPLRGTAG